MYCAYVTRIRNLRKHTNADRLLCGECFGNTVNVDLGTEPDQLGIYFRYLDQDYEDLKKILGVDPLKITMLKCGTFAAYNRKFGTTIRKMNPESCEINDLLTCHQYDSLERRWTADDWI